MPKEARILSVAEQRGSLCVWAAVDPSNDWEDREVVIIGTGNLFDDRLLKTHHAMNQPVATVDYPLEKRLIATRLHSFVTW